MFYFIVFMVENLYLYVRMRLKICLDAGIPPWRIGGCITLLVLPWAQRRHPKVFLIQTWTPESVSSWILASKSACERPPTFKYLPLTPVPDQDRISTLD